VGGPSGARLIRRGNEQLSFGVGAPKERSVRGSTGKERYVSDSTNASYLFERGTQ